MLGLVEQPGLVKGKMALSAVISRKRLSCGVISNLIESSRSIRYEQLGMDVSAGTAACIDPHSFI